jgi:hypothetical protein
LEKYRAVETTTAIAAPKYTTIQAIFLRFHVFFSSSITDSSPFKVKILSFSDHATQMYIKIHLALENIVEIRFALASSVVSYSMTDGSFLNAL